jgi:hypothetical protein
VRYVARLEETRFVVVPEGRSLEDLDINGSTKLKQRWNTWDRTV